MKLVEIKNENLSVGISKVGAELMYVRDKKGTDFLWCGDESVWGFRAPILFPICGGLKNDEFMYNGKSYTLKKHGFLRSSELVCTYSDDTKAEFTLVSDEQTLECYPFIFKLVITYELAGNRIDISYKINNMTDGEMYFSIGSHEAYSCPEGIEEYEVRFENPQTLDSFELCGNLLDNKSIRLIENSCVLPLRYKYFAIDALVFKNVDFNKVSLVHKKSGKRVDVRFDGAKYFLLWTKPNGKYICIEPWHGIQDSIDSDGDITHKEGIIHLEKDGTYEMLHSIEFFNI